MKTTISDFYCVECGTKGIPIPRRNGSQREPGHLKNLFCFNCKKETNHAEVRPFGTYTLDSFREEFEAGRFVNGKKFPIAELLSCDREECEYNINGRCWNSNNSANCAHKAILENGSDDETMNLLKRGW